MNNTSSNNSRQSILSQGLLEWITLVFLLICFLIWLTTHFGYAINLTDSLPKKYFLVHFNQKPKVCDLIVFRAPSALKLGKELTFTKRVMGVGGDRVTQKNRHFFINDHWVGRAKTHSLKGEPLKTGPTGIIPEGQYYVATEHKDSFDSRYQEMGWITLSQCIGVAYPLW
jgi:conjugal transfer pilin signal peptidase TrbI